jgi:TRAP-type C4-dicarboxylate transport system permease small subunit
MRRLLVTWWARLGRLDDGLAALALVGMTLVPVIELALRPFHGRGVENAPVLVQHLGLVLAMFGALAAERHGHLTSLVGQGGGADTGPRSVRRNFADAVAALVCGVLALASWRFVASEMLAPNDLAYGLPAWVVQFSMPLAFGVLGAKLGARCGVAWLSKIACGLTLPVAGFWFAWHLDGQPLMVWPGLVVLLGALLAGAPIFAMLGGLALALFWQEGLPLASSIGVHTPGGESSAYACAHSSRLDKTTPNKTDFFMLGISCISLKWVRTAWRAARGRWFV